MCHKQRPEVVERVFQTLSKGHKSGVIFLNETNSRVWVMDFRWKFLISKRWIALAEKRQLRTLLVVVHQLPAERQTNSCWGAMQLTYTPIIRLFHYVTLLLRNWKSPFSLTSSESSHYESESIFHFLTVSHREITGNFSFSLTTDWHGVITRKCAPHPHTQLQPLNLEKFSKLHIQQHGSGRPAVDPVRRRAPLFR